MQRVSTQILMVYMNQSIHKFQPLTVPGGVAGTSLVKLFCLAAVQLCFEAKPTTGDIYQRPSNPTCVSAVENSGEMPLLIWELQEQVLSDIQFSGLSKNMQSPVQAV